MDIFELTGWDPADFPHLLGDDPAVLAAADTTYNCIAWSVGNTTDWLWPGARAVWPPNLPRETSIPVFVAFYISLGYQPVGGPEDEKGYEKVALYVGNDEPLHAARQGPDGTWSSKMGCGPVLRHRTVRGLEGPVYGTAVLFFRRPVQQ